MERRKLELGELGWYHRLVYGFGWLAYRELTRKACQEAKVTGVSFMQVRLPLSPSSQGGGRISHRPKDKSGRVTVCGVWSQSGWWRRQIRLSQATTPRCMMGFHVQLFVLNDALAENMLSSHLAPMIHVRVRKERRPHQNSPKNCNPIGRRRRS